MSRTADSVVRQCNKVGCVRNQCIRHRIVQFDYTVAQFGRVVCIGCDAAIGLELGAFLRDRYAYLTLS
jgi:hypothetical protein